MKPERSIKFLAVVTILYWLSLSLHLPPFVHTPNFDDTVALVLDSDIAEILKEVRPELDLPKEELLAKLESEYRRSVVRQYMIILVGAISGVLIYFRLNFGKYLSICVAISMLSYKSIIFMQSCPKIFDRFVLYFTRFLPTWPLSALHEVFGIIFFVTSIFILMKRDVSILFRKII